MMKVQQKQSHASLFKLTFVSPLASAIIQSHKYYDVVHLQSSEILILKYFHDVHLLTVGFENLCFGQTLPFICFQ